MIKDLWILRAGKLKLDRSVLLMGTGYGIKEMIPIYATLLETTEGYILIDTGMNTDGIDNPEEIWGERAKQLVPCLTKEDNIGYRLREMGVKESDIKFVINTHMHWDHTGGNNLFPEAVFVVQKSEYRFSLYPDTAIGKSYMENHYPRNAKYKLVEGDCDLCEGIRLLQTPGHTIGHQSVLLTLQNGNRIIITGDAVYTWDNLEKMIPPGNCFDYEMAMFSLNKLRTIQEVTGAVIMPSHDPREDFYDRVDSMLDGIKK
ncbi:MAG TPA: N-acyl homoserine lactonase family protein [Anaerovoracaceae bacterium]|nr:N-acyl homoserine lactonase family protein [Anaerovoracaceae bacterium]